MTEPPWRSRPRFVQALALVLLAGASLAGLELVARLKFAREQLVVSMTGELEHDPLVGWRGRRGFSGRVRHGRHPVDVRVEINADGFRDESWDAKLARAAGRGSRRVLVLGDSLVYGWANPADGRLSAQLQARYAAAGQAAEVFDAGIPGYGPNHQLRLLPELLARLQPHAVVLVFCTNDYGDAALPYDYRYPFRVYQPFYDQAGELLFNARVPRRLSLALRDTPLGGLRLWVACDRLKNVWEDREYARHGLPNARNAPIARLNDLFGDRALLARFPYVEPTVFELYRRMARLSEAAGARFTFVPSVTRVPGSGESIDARLRAPLEARGVGYLPCPADVERYQAFLPTLLDGHPNLVWAALLAAGVHARLEGSLERPVFASLPETQAWPSELELSDDAACARALCAGWRERESGGRRFAGSGAFILRNPRPGAVRLEVSASAPAATRLRVEVLDAGSACRLGFGPGARTESCALDTTTLGALVFGTLTVEGAAEPLIGRLRLLPAAASGGARR